MDCIINQNKFHLEYMKPFALSILCNPLNVHCPPWPTYNCLKSKISLDDIVFHIEFLLHYKLRKSGRVALESWFQSFCFTANSILDRMAGVQVQRWIDKFEAVFDSQSEVAPLSGGDTKTILTPRPG